MTQIETFRIRRVDASQLQAERERVACLIREAIPSASVMEVGSTAIEGLVGKQDLDFAVRVPSQRFDETRLILDRTFPRNTGQLSNDEYQGYLVPSPLDVAIQLIIEGGRHDNFEKFLLALRTDPSLRHAYNNLKSAWDGRPMQEYRLAKQRFIDSVLSDSKAPVL